METEEMKNRFNYSDVVSEVIAGDWDNLVRPIKEDKLYASFEKHFIEGDPWEKTPIYSYRKEQFEKSNPVWGCNNMSEFEERLAELDKLYENISNCGYKLQRELRSDSGNLLLMRNIHHYWPPNLQEVTINIGRDGTPILHDGRHRLFISKLTGLERVPVRVKTRHRNWQRYREKVYKTEDGSGGVDHPDLLFKNDT